MSAKILYCIVYSIICCSLSHDVRVKSKLSVFLLPNERKEKVPFTLRFIIDFIAFPSQKNKKCFHQHSKKISLSFICVSVQIFYIIHILTMCEWKWWCGNEKKELFFFTAFVVRKRKSLFCRNVDVRIHRQTKREKIIPFTFDYFKMYLFCLEEFPM